MMALDPLSPAAGARGRLWLAGGLLAWLWLLVAWALA
jgi:hypothetical protein